MNVTRLFSAIILTLVLTVVPVMAEQKVTDEKALGEKLLNQLWENMHKPDVEMIEKTTAEGFQAVHQFGSNNREEEIELIRKLKLGPYTLSEIKITRSGPVIVATYLVSVSETIKGKRLTRKPAPRLSVFLNTGEGWKWIAHANLKPLQ